MPKEIFPSSYRCDCGHQSDFFENTIREAKAKSFKKKIYLGDSARDEHTIVFHKGRMIAILCPQNSKESPSKREHGIEASPKLTRESIAGGHSLPEKIRVSVLKNVTVFYEGDLYELACLLLRFHDAQDKGKTSRSYHTVSGLASAYAMITGVPRDEILMILEPYHLPMGVAVHHDAE